MVRRVAKAGCNVRAAPDRDTRQPVQSARVSLRRDLSLGVEEERPLARRAVEHAVLVAEVVSGVVGDGRGTGLDATRWLVCVPMFNVGKAPGSIPADRLAEPLLGTWSYERRCCPGCAKL